MPYKCMHNQSDDNQLPALHQLQHLRHLSQLDMYQTLPKAFFPKSFVFCLVGNLQNYLNTN